MRIAGLLALTAIVVAACGRAEAAPQWPEQTYGAITVRLVKPSGTPFVAPPVPVGNAVALIGSTFEPTPLQVPLGTTVTWTNRDVIAHTVTSGVPGFPDGKWDGQLGGLGATFALTLSVPGTYAYYCRFHAGGMHGIIDVR